MGEAVQDSHLHLHCALKPKCFHLLHPHHCPMRGSVGCYQSILQMGTLRLRGAGTCPRFQRWDQSPVTVCHSGATEDRGGAAEFSLPDKLHICPSRTSKIITTTIKKA